MRVVALLACLTLFGCELEEPDASGEEPNQSAGGSAERGRVLLSTYGCDACHTIPGVPGADRTVGPPLTGISRRLFVAGSLPNNPANLTIWIRDPPAIDSLTAMPALGVTERDARDIVAYLYAMD